MKQAVMHAKLREGLEVPRVRSLGDTMSQGGQKTHAVPHGLSEQMGQDTNRKSYKRGRPTHGLAKQMGQ